LLQVTVEKSVKFVRHKQIKVKHFGNVGFGKFYTNVRDVVLL